jgi:hypothetical protein
MLKSVEKLVARLAFLFFGTVFGFSVSVVIEAYERPLWRWWCRLCSVRVISPLRLSAAA